MWSAQDTDYWLEKEETIRASLVDLADYGLVVASVSHARGYTDDSRCLIRPAVAEALQRAERALPEGHRFKVIAGWRPWSVQQQVADVVLTNLRTQHPDWTEEQLLERRRVLAPLQRIIPNLASHRYGGAVDVEVLDARGETVNMGVSLQQFAKGPEADLLFYEYKQPLAEGEETFRANRRMLIAAMHAGGFAPYLAEFWHWSYLRDISMLTEGVQA